MGCGSNCVCVCVFLRHHSKGVHRTEREAPEPLRSAGGLPFWDALRSAWWCQHLQPDRCEGANAGCSLCSARWSLIPPAWENARLSGCPQTKGRQLVFFILLSHCVDKVKKKKKEKQFLSTWMFYLLIYWCFCSYSQSLTTQLFWMART